MSLEREISDLIVAVLQVPQLRGLVNADSPLLGAIPEFDSMAVVSIITSIEDRFGVMVDDDDIDASTFETVGSLVHFVQSKMSN